MKKPSSIQRQIFRNLLLVIAGAGLLQILLWTAYQFYEVSRHQVVPHMQVNQILILIIIDALTIPIVVWILLRITHGVTLPLRSMAEASREIQDGNLKVRIRTEDLPSGELTEVGQAVNDAFNRYEEARERVAAFSANASHQLRTPLTAIQTSAELALTSPKGGEEYYRNVLTDILEETRRVHRIVEQLLMLTRFDQHAIELAFLPIDLVQVVHTVAADFEAYLDEQGIQFSMEAPAEARVMGSRDLLYELFANLIDNAIKACSKGDRIAAEIARDSDQWQVTVSDSGPGIAVSERTLLFQRFSRSPSADYQGIGLGLSISRSIARAHRGEICVVESALGGAGFRLQLPAAANAELGA